ncbi:DUF4293 domain-containing protein [Taibaiella sp. KBW10]|uniref:DUF4293 domain-containing protein n=1 Tax=Taibaiella sp. KBW10 TaxID=2153357 RepID=UPI000F5AB87A|nr:DUF4293 domain-containing protein [Taibaiella sp. KBW10]RQO30546.1 DUF4293 domain-containing protein [Taibaiella sp. KBW10]
MIQRIQSVWLLLAGLAMAGMFYFNVYQSSPTMELTAEALNSLRKITNIKNDYLAIVLAGLSTIISLVSIFMFKNRKRQIGLIWINILLSIGLLFWLFVGLNSFWNNYPGAQGNLWIGMFLPFITVFFLIFALRGIRKDEKLIKSLDRLR